MEFRIGCNFLHVIFGDLLLQVNLFMASKITKLMCERIPRGQLVHWGDVSCIMGSKGSLSG